MSNLKLAIRFSDRKADSFRAEDGNLSKLACLEVWFLFVGAACR